MQKKFSIFFIIIGLFDLAAKQNIKDAFVINYFKKKSKKENDNSYVIKRLIKREKHCFDPLTLKKLKFNKQNYKQTVIKFYVYCRTRFIMMNYIIT